MKTTGNIESGGNVVKSLRIAACAVVVLISIALTSCCTAIGYLVGHGIDNHARGGPQVSDLKDIGDLNLGQNVEVVLAGGDTVRGGFYGVAPVPAEEYEQAILTIAHTLDSVMFPPNMGEPIRVVNEKNGATSVVDGTFCGFEPSHVVLQTKTSDKIERLPLATMVSIVDSARHSVSGGNVRRWMSQGRIPCLTSMTFVVGDNTMRIPSGQIASVKTPGKYYATEAFMGAGAVLDIVVIISLKDMNFSSPSHSNSWNWHF